MGFIGRALQLLETLYGRNNEKQKIVHPIIEEDTLSYTSFIN